MANEPSFDGWRATRFVEQAYTRQSWPLLGFSMQVKAYHAAVVRFPDARTAVLQEGYHHCLAAVGSCLVHEVDLRRHDWSSPLISSRTPDGLSASMKLTTFFHVNAREAHKIALARNPHWLMRETITGAIHWAIETTPHDTLVCCEMPTNQRSDLEARLSGRLDDVLDDYGIQVDRVCVVTCTGDKEGRALQVALVKAQREHRLAQETADIDVTKARKAAEIWEHKRVAEDYQFDREMERVREGHTHERDITALAKLGDILNGLSGPGGVTDMAYMPRTETPQSAATLREIYGEKLDGLLRLIGRDEPGLHSRPGDPSLARYDWLISEAVELALTSDYTLSVQHDRKDGIVLVVHLDPLDYEIACPIEGAHSSSDIRVIDGDKQAIYRRGKHESLATALRHARARFYRGNGGSADAGDARSDGPTAKAA